jgi:hypothetical protein
MTRSGQVLRGWGLPGFAEVAGMSVCGTVAGHRVEQRFILTLSDRVAGSAARVFLRENG